MEQMLGDNGQKSQEELAEEVTELTSASKNLDDFKRPDGVLVRLTKDQVSLLKGMSAPLDGVEDRFVVACSRANFLDEYEARRHVAAYFEAKRLGMNTDINIAYTEALRATNRKGGYRTNITGVILEALQHQKFTSNVARSRSSHDTSARSPIT